MLPYIYTTKKCMYLVVMYFTTSTIGMHTKSSRHHLHNFFYASINSQTTLLHKTITFLTSTGFYICPKSYIHPIFHTHLSFFLILHLKTMPFSNWKNSRRKSVRFCAQREEESSPKWSLFCKITGKSKKQRSPSNSPIKQQMSYDPESYMHNFDEGLERVDPDNLYRSFSARYADPTPSRTPSSA